MSFKSFVQEAKVQEGRSLSEWLNETDESGENAMKYLVDWKIYTFYPFQSVMLSNLDWHDAGEKKNTEALCY